MTHSNGLNDLKSSEVKFSKLLLGKILLKVDKNATDANRCGNSRIQFPPNSVNPAKRPHPSEYFISITRLLEGVLLVFEETFQDFQIAIFPFNTVFPLNINLYQLSYSPGV